MGRDKETSLAPGFRFHPTDEELVRYYLKRKVSSKPFRFDPISVVDIYKSEPWDLPSKSKLKSRDLEWYFFSALDRKYGSSLRTNRATEKGYWKTTGKDRPVHQNSRTVGMKKTLVYHSGRAPHGARSNWVMHEYRLVDEELEKAGIAIDTFVLCRVFQKSGTGPKNGEQYGAPFVEEEWDDDVATFMPDEDAAVDKVVIGDGATDDLDQDLEISIPSKKTPCPLNFYYGETSNYDDHCGDFIEVDQKPIIVRSETFEPRHDQQVADMPEQYVMDIKPINDDYFVELNNSMNPMEVNYSLNKPYLDDTDNPLLGDGLFLESNDLLDPAESDPAGFDVLDEYLTFLNSDDDVVFDPSEIVRTEKLVSDQAPLTQKYENGGTDLVYPESIRLSEAQGSNDASSSTQKPEATIYESDIKNPFIKRATDTLDSIAAPPAFASEFPAKDAALHFHSAAQSSSSVHVTAGMIRIRNMTSTGNGTDWLLGKNVDINLIMPYSLLQGDINSASLVAMTDLHAGKTSSIVLRSWFFLMLFWVLILPVSFKIASYIHIK